MTQDSGQLVGTSHAMERVRRFVERASSVDAPVLLLGETGTGKSAVARLVHARSRRRAAPLLTVNCAGVPDGLFESEFFGHERGAFTGAAAARRGLFEAAGGGTLFLDEVGELPPGQQAKLLTVLENGEVRRVGGCRSVAIDVRVVSATDRELDAALADGGFRRDLYHRLALLRCRLPPLRERRQDLPVLVRHFLPGLAEKHGKPGIVLDPEAAALLSEHPWPGNVRELIHALEASVILAEGDRIGSAHLSAALLPAPEAREPLLPAPEAGVPLLPADRSGGEAGAGAAVAAGRPVAPVPPAPDGRYSFYGTPEEEKAMILEALERCRGNRTRTARELGMSRNTLRSRLRRYGL